MNFISTLPVFISVLDVSISCKKVEIPKSFLKSIDLVNITLYKMFYRRVRLGWKHHRNVSVYATGRHKQIVFIMYTSFVIDEVL